MGRVPCCDHESSGLKKGPWTPEEDKKLVDHITQNGLGSWRSVPKLSGLNRCGKSCRLRWTNYLRPDIKRGQFSDEEERIIIDLHSALGNKWSKIANHLPGRTDNEIKNYWNTSLRKKLLQKGIDPNTHKPRTDLSPLHNFSQLLSSSQFTNLLLLMNSSTNWHNALKLQPQTTSDQMVKIHFLQNLFHGINSPRNNSTSTCPQNLNNPIFEACTNNNNINANNYQIGDPGFDHCINGTADDQYRPVENWGSWDCVEDIDHLQDEIINPVLPMLVSEPFNTGNSIRNNEQMGNKITSVEPDCETIFETWDELLGNGDSSESYWKDMLELMSDPPSF